MNLCALVQLFDYDSSCTEMGNKFSACEIAPGTNEDRRVLSQTISSSTGNSRVLPKATSINSSIYHLIIFDA